MRDARDMRIFEWQFKREEEICGYLGDSLRQKREGYEDIWVAV